MRAIIVKGIVYREVGNDLVPATSMGEDLELRYKIWYSSVQNYVLHCPVKTAEVVENRFYEISDGVLEIVSKSEKKRSNSDVEKGSVESHFS